MKKAYISATSMRRWMDDDSPVCLAIYDLGGEDERAYIVEGENAIDDFLLNRQADMYTVRNIVDAEDDPYVLDDTGTKWFVAEEEVQ